MNKERATTTNDWIAEHGHAFLGSRLRRLAEQMQEDVGQLSQRTGMALQPGQLPLLAILLERGPQTVGELARTMGLSQPVTTRNISKLIERGLVQVGRSDTDGRSKIVALTTFGERAIVRSRDTVWPHVEAAVRQITEGLSGPFLEQIAAIEKALAERPLARRAASLAAAELVAIENADVPALVTLINRAYRGDGSEGNNDNGVTVWNREAGYITGTRTTQSLLREEIAAKPHASMLAWRDRHDGVLKGCVWVEPLGDNLWYLGSLAISLERQQGGLGHSLLSCAEQWISERGGKRVRISVINVRDALIEWYERRGYRKTGETSPFPYGDERFGQPQRDDLAFIGLEKDLMPV